MQLSDLGFWLCYPKLMVLTIWLANFLSCYNIFDFINFLLNRQFKFGKFVLEFELDLEFFKSDVGFFIFK